MSEECYNKNMGGPRLNIEWDKVEDLGKVIDRVIAERLGCSTVAVMLARKALGLPAASSIDPTLRGKPVPTGTEVAKVGQEFGKLKVIEIFWERRQGKAYWFARCECTCGGTRTVRPGDLKRGSMPGYQIDCGCFGIKVGDQFGYLTVEEVTERRARRGRVAIMRCSCGQTVLLPCESLKRSKRGRSRKCCGRACSALDKNIVSAKRMQQTKARIKRAQKQGRDLQFTISKRELSALWDAQNGRCALTDVELVMVRKRNPGTASLDRIDSDGHYEIGNVRWVHKQVNVMRQTLTDQEFVKWCRLVVRKAEQEAVGTGLGAQINGTGASPP